MQVSQPLLMSATTTGTKRSIDNNADGEAAGNKALCVECCLCLARGDELLPYRLVTNNYHVVDVHGCRHCFDDADSDSDSDSDSDDANTNTNKLLKLIRCPYENASGVIPMRYMPGTGAGCDLPSRADLALRPACSRCGTVRDALTPVTTMVVRKMARTKASVVPELLEQLCDECGSCYTCLTVPKDGKLVPLQDFSGESVAVCRANCARFCKWCSAFHMNFEDHWQDGTTASNRYGLACIFRCCVCHKQSELLFSNSDQKRRFCTQCVLRSRFYDKATDEPDWRQLIDGVLQVMRERKS